MIISMKKIKLLTLTILMAISFSLTGCADKKTGITESAFLESAEKGETNSGEFKIELVEENMIPIGKMKIPSYLFCNETDHLPILEENEDSITCELTQIQQKELLYGLVSQLEDGINQVLSDKAYYPALTEISINKDCTEFNVTFSGTELNTYETTLRMSLYIAGDKLQLYQGIPEAQILTVVNYINSDTGETFSEGNSGSLH